jgi:hypothetical protein
MAAPKKKSARSSRSKRSSNNTLTVIILVGIIAFGVYYAFTGRDILGIFPTAEVPLPLTPSAESPAQPGDWWEVYFADPINIKDPDNWQNSIEAHLIDKINAAQTSIHIASFEFDLTPVAEALWLPSSAGWMCAG